MTGGREPLSRPSSRHGEARHPLTLPADAGRRASGQRDYQDKKPHPDGRWSSLSCPCRRKGGACRLSRPAHAKETAGGRVRAGPPRQTPRPQERAGTARGTVRATSPAPILGALRGVPAEVGRRRRVAASTREDTSSRRKMLFVRQKCTVWWTPGGHRKPNRAVHANEVALEHIDISGKTGAGEGIRTLDPNLGKVVLYP
jgi:hypothetical protein